MDDESLHNVTALPFRRLGKLGDDLYGRCKGCTVCHQAFSVTEIKKKQLKEICNKMTIKVVTQLS